MAASMTRVLITVDTELSLRLFQDGALAMDNYARSIAGECEGGPVGIGWQMDVLDGYGLKGVYFVDPFPALVHGINVIEDIVAPIASRGHEVQLHIHTEWLQWAKTPIIGGRQGRSIGDFALEDQLFLVDLARRLLVEAGAPTPTAFRAGNFGANDDTLRALSKLGFQWDSSYAAAFRNMGCIISIDPAQAGPVRHLGMAELPVSGIGKGGDVRPAQICALSAAEMDMALEHAAATGHPTLNIVTHSFEMMSRDRKRPNGLVMDRFEALCLAIANHPSLETSGFADLDASLADQDWSELAHCPAHPVRKMRRQAEQLWGSLRYERSLRRA
jgi:hypothetical protein